MGSAKKAGPVDGVDLEVVLVRNLRRLLAERDWRHADLANAMRTYGFRWNPNTPTQVVNLYRHLSLMELAVLCSIFGQPLSALLEGDDLIETPLGKEWIHLAHVREYLVAGKTSTPLVRTTIFVHDTAPEEHKAMDRLGVTLGDLQAASQHLFGTTSIVRERDRRLGDVANLPARAVQAKRGHAMRSVLRELGDYFAKQHS